MANIADLMKGVEQHPNVLAHKGNCTGQESLKGKVRVQGGNVICLACTHWILNLYDEAEKKV